MPQGEALKRAVTVGLIAGGIVVYLGVVGLIEKLDVRSLVGSAVSAGGLTLVLPSIVAGYIVTRPRVRAGQMRVMPVGEAVGMGAVAGLASGIVVLGFLGVVNVLEQVTVRTIFIAVTPKLLDILQFGRGGAAAAIPAWIVIGAALGAAGAASRSVAPSIARPVKLGLLALLAFAFLQRIIPPAMRELGLQTTWLYSPITGGLTLGGAIVVFGVAGGIVAGWRARGARVRQAVDRLPESGRFGVRAAGFVVLAGLLIVLPNLIGSVLTNALGTVGIFLLMGIGLNIVVGYAGLLDLGYVAFFAVGAYFTALFTGARVVSALGETTQAVVFSLNFWLALPLVIAVAAIVGLMIGAPVLRLRGDYLAIVTLGFGEIARVLVTSRWLQSVLGGAQGLRDVPTAPGFGRDPRSIYYLVVAFVFIAIFISSRLADSRIGRAWSAMREDEQVAEAMGISTTRYKLLAFAIGAAVGCLSGALFAIKIGSLAPTSFTILVSITALSVIILGGMGSIRGVVIGSLVLIGLPELLTEFEEFRLLIYGAVLVAIMILKPDGLLPNVRRSRELRDEERAQDQWFRRSGGAGADATVTVAGDEA